MWACFLNGCSSSVHATLRSLDDLKPRANVWFPPQATVDYEAQDEAVLAKILVQAGTADVPVGTPIMVLVENAEDAAAFKDYVAEGGAASSASSAPVAEAAPTPAPAPAPAAAPSPPSQPPAPAVSAPSAYTGDRVVASPLAKHVSACLGNPSRS